MDGVFFLGDVECVFLLWKKLCFFCCVWVCIRKSILDNDGLCYSVREKEFLLEELEYKINWIRV